MIRIGFEPLPYRRYLLNTRNGNSIRNCRAVQQTSSENKLPDEAWNRFRAVLAIPSQQNSAFHVWMEDTSASARKSEFMIGF